MWYRESHLKGNIYYLILDTYHFDSKWHDDENDTIGLIYISINVYEIFIDMV